MKRHKVETFRTEHRVPLATCQDLTESILLPTLTMDAPIMKVKVVLEVFPMDAQSSHLVHQIKLHLASLHQGRDRIVETKEVFYINGRRKVEAGKDIQLIAYEPRFEEEAQGGCCCLGLPGVKKAKVSVIKKVVKAPPHRQWAPTAPMPDITPAYPYPGQA